MPMNNAPHPGEILNELYIKGNNLSVSSTASALGISRQTLYDLVNGKTGISPQTALKLAKAFSTSPMYWMNLQARYDLSKALPGAHLEETSVLTER